MGDYVSVFCGYFYDNVPQLAISKLRGGKFYIDNYRLKREGWNALG